jgi:uncharacterized membrane protein YdjX (TVP38/TMEM64 family)
MAGEKVVNILMRISFKTILWVTLTVTVSLVTIFYLKKHFHEAEVIIGSLGLLGPLISILLYALLALSPITTDPLSVANVIIFGPLWGAMVTSVGNTAGALVEYFFGRHIGNTTKAHEYLDKLPFGFGKIPVNTIWFLVGGRLIPGYGTKIVSILAGIRHVPLTRYLWTTLLTTTIGAILISAGTHGIKALFQNIDIF